jgi:hypothetical protein
MLLAMISVPLRRAVIAEDLPNPSPAVWMNQKAFIWLE